MIWTQAEIEEKQEQVRMIRDSAASMVEQHGGLKRARELRYTDTGISQEVWRDISELAINIAGERSGTLEPFVENCDLRQAGLFIQSRPTTIYGGTNEVQRNILAKHVLGLGS